MELYNGYDGTEQLWFIVYLLELFECAENR